MGKLWCRDLRVVTIPRGDQPKSVTFIYPYYENPVFVQKQIANWWSYPEDLRTLLTVIVVDDGSPIEAVLPEDRPCVMRLFRINQDIRWNWLAARNIGAHHAQTDWLLLTDMDHLVPVETMEALVYGKHDPFVVYTFARREHTGLRITPHSASFLMTRDLFWTIGGYDEALSGHYGTDGEFRRRVAAHAPIQVLTDDLVRYEYHGDSSTTRYRRKQPEDAAVRQIVAARRPNWKPKVLSFAYAEVA